MAIAINAKPTERWQARNTKNRLASTSSFYLSLFDSFANWQAHFSLYSWQRETLLAQSVQITEKHKRQQAEIKATSRVRRKANDGNNTRYLPSGYISLSLSLRTYSTTSNMSSSKSFRTLGCYLFHFFSYSTSYPSVQRTSSYDT